MATIFKYDKRRIVLENVTHIQVSGEVALVYPAEYYTVRVTGEAAKEVVEKAKAIGFISDDGFGGSQILMINPARLVMAEEENAIAHLMMDGCPKMLTVPVEFLQFLEPGPDPVSAPAVSSAGKSKSKKPSAE